MAVANGYLKLADSVASRQDAVAALNIALASGAALSIINGASDTSVLRVGVAGVAVNQTASYFNPKDARDALTRAARRQFCIVNKVNAFGAPEGDTVRSMIADGFTTVRFALRADLDRDLNSYSVLSAQYKTATEAKRDAVGVLTADEVKKLGEEIAGCVPGN